VVETGVPAEGEKAVREFCALCDFSGLDPASVGSKTAFLVRQKRRDRLLSSLKYDLSPVAARGDAGSFGAAAMRPVPSNGGFLMNRFCVAGILALTLLCAGSFAGPARAVGTTRYVTPFGIGLNLSCSSPGFNSIQTAVFASVPGDTIIVCDGVYNEQVGIPISLLTLAGSGNAIIQPTVPGGNLNVVEVTGRDVIMSGFTVAGPGPTGCNSIHTGIAVFGGGSLDLSNTTVRDIRDNPFSGCQNGEGIRVGTARGSSTPDVGQATIDNVIVTHYQKNGIVIAGTNSTGKITNTTVTGFGPTTTIAQNGIIVRDGAKATISTSTMRDNDYTPKGTTACGLLIIAAGGVNDDKTDVYLNNEQDKCTVNGRGGTFEG
jgi:hypothetical protein